MGLGSGWSARAGKASAAHSQAKTKLSKNEGVQQAKEANSNKGKSPQYPCMEATKQSCHPTSSFMVLPRAFEQAAYLRHLTLEESLQVLLLGLNVSSELSTLRLQLVLH